MTLRLVLTASALCLPLAAYAVGSDDSSDAPPTPTATTTECPEGQVYDADAEGCVVIQDSRLDDDGLYRAARELAYAERYTDALAALAEMSDPMDSRVLTYRAFIARQMGQMEASFALYDQALAVDPDNLLARSYLGMAHVAGGEMAKARTQLWEIRARGGSGGWPHRALGQAILTGATTDY